MPAYRYVSGVGYVATGSADLGVDLPTPRAVPARRERGQLEALGIPPEAERVPAGATREVVDWIDAGADDADKARRGQLALEHEAAKPGGGRAGVMAAARKAVALAPAEDDDGDEPDDEPESDDEPEQPTLPDELMPHELDAS